jgi:hypothetical protein
MALRDTLQRIKEDEDERRFLATHTEQILAEWLAALDNLFELITDALRPLVEDKFLTVNLIRVRKTEELLGEYECPALLIDITIKPIRINVRPVGRITAGSDGRVDLYREDRRYEEGDVFRLLRKKDLRRLNTAEDNIPNIWLIQLNPVSVEIVKITNMMYPFREPQRGYEPFSNESVERVIEYLIQL